MLAKPYAKRLLFLYFVMIGNSDKVVLFRPVGTCGGSVERTSEIFHFLFNISVIFLWGFLNLTI